MNIIATSLVEVSNSIFALSIGAAERKPDEVFDDDPPPLLPPQDCNAKTTKTNKKQQAMKNNHQYCE
jgi:hypothetical protein